jgi:hypothetical protein
VMYRLIVFAACFVGLLFCVSLATPFLFQRSGLTPEWFTVAAVAGCVVAATVVSASFSK